jgi:hypothetical protein
MESGCPLPPPSFLPEETLKEALRNALATILNQARMDESSPITLVTPSMTPVSSASASLSSLGLRKWSFPSREALLVFLMEEQADFHYKPPLDAFMLEEGSGLLCVCLSAILTRTLSQTRRDWSGFSAHFLTQNGYSGQELVNLLAVGRAIPHIHDHHVGDNHKEEEEETDFSLEGLRTRSLVGFLTLVEAYDQMKAGSYFKNPLFGVWVIYSESHYSVLFQPSYQQDQSPFPLDLFYFDPLLRPTHLTHFTLLPEEEEEEEEEDLEPPLNKVLRTKWGERRKIDWNGEEPAL